MELSNRTNLKEDIVVFDGFITKEECDAILKYWQHCETTGELDWVPVSFYRAFTSYMPDDDDMVKFGIPRDFFINLEGKMKEAVEIARGGKMKKMSIHPQKWITGAFASPHSDNSDSAEGYNEFEQLKWATFLYLNGDFEGGELKFENHGISIKPQAGMLVAFNGGFHNQHEVKLITSGVRYNIGSFWDFAESQYSQEKLQFWAKKRAKINEEIEEQWEKWSKE